ncbi:MAG: FHA domain-containing protein [Proteobacteria bacterium]|nr:FHA domain-containing protein [Pseudomonadota bacterium]MBS0608817.1 FHA domain-containing protein [Pseudomonadota bacterium]
MPRMVVSIDGVVIKEVPLTQERTTVGRRPYNDVVIDNLAVSGEHAVLVMHGDEVQVHDLGSTNGTFVNGKVVRQQLLRNGDIVEMGKYRIRFLQEARQDYENTVLFEPGRPLASPPARLAAAPVVLSGSVRVLAGPAVGREVALTKVVTTIGKPGVAVASITRRHHSFVLAHVEGADELRLNGAPIGAEHVPLKNGDRIVLAGAEMEFLSA